MAEKLTRANKSAVLVPDEAQMGVLSNTERIGFRLAHFMNGGWRKRLMTFGQRHLGSLWIRLATYNLMEVSGIEHIQNSKPDKPLVLAANHRSFFDMYTVSSVLFRQTKRPIKLFFPVRAKFFYDSPVGWLVNFVMGWFSMYPPFFREQKEASKREFDKYSLERLVELCKSGKHHVVGFHPEGKRNLDPDENTFLPAQPGIGRVIYEAKPQVIPVFIAGLGNNLPKQVLGNWRGGDKIRIHFGAPINFSEFYSKPNRLRTHKEIADHLMTKIASLAGNDGQN
ncbi:MAG: lysophospholipid acyltransferase family protein [Pyrinomonadaceae bacterium]